MRRNPSLIYGESHHIGLFLFSSRAEVVRRFSSCTACVKKYLLVKIVPLHSLMPGTATKRIRRSMTTCISQLYAVAFSARERENERRQAESHQQSVN